MAQRGNGGIIGPANVPNAATASGVWTLEEQQEAKGLNSWPGFAIQRSLRFNSADFCNLYRTPASTTNTRTFTMSVWIKRALLAGSGGYTNDQKILNVGGGTNQTNFAISSDFLSLYDNQSTVNCNLQFSAKLRDVSAWYHIVLSVDTTQAVSTDRVKMYLNGTRLTATEPSASTFYAQNATTLINTTNQHFIGKQVNAGFPDWYMTEVNFIDGQALTPSSFGITNPDTGVWQPKAYAGTYGTNGFYLNFSDNSNTTATTLGKDYSGNGNNWTPENFSVSAGAGNDSLVDVPTAWGTDTGVGGTVRGNYCTFSPIQNYGLTLANGNLDVSVPSSSSSYNQVAGTIGVSAGKWYFEYYMSQLGSNGNVMVGVMNQNNNVGPSTPYATASTWLLDNNANGKIYARNSPTATDLGSRPAAAFTGMVAIDLDAGKIWFGANGTWLGSGDPATGVNPQFSNLSGVLQPIAHGYTVGDTGIGNFGQRPFAYTAPSGYKTLCTQNLPTPTIGATAATQAGKYFNPVIYTAPVNSSTLTVTGVGFQPDFTWWKTRSASDSNVLMNVLSGSNKYLLSNSTNAEATFSGIWTPTSDGFTASALSYSSNQTYVAWNWKANGAGVTNTAGSITSTVSANTTSGFSVVTYAGNSTLGATIGHGLGAAPRMIIVKSRSGTTNWVVYHASIGNTKALFLNTTSATDTDNYWNNTSPTSTVFSVNASTGLNSSGSNYVAYCFAEVQGFSKFGSYTGNGNTDGPFVYCGFRPAYVMVKCSSPGGSDTTWVVKDKLRAAPYNPQDGNLYPNLANAEDTISTVYVDFLSNGFKIRGTYGGINGSSQTYIFAAFAEAPQKFALAR